MGIALIIKSLHLAINQSFLVTLSMQQPDITQLNTKISQWITLLSLYLEVIKQHIKICCQTEVLEEAQTKRYYHWFNETNYSSSQALIYFFIAKNYFHNQYFCLFIVMKSSFKQEIFTEEAMLQEIFLPSDNLFLLVLSINLQHLMRFIRTKKEGIMPMG